MCVYVCVLRCGSSRGERRLERGRGRSEESESLSVRASDLVRVPGWPGLWERGRRPGGVSGIRLRDEWAGDEWREAAAAKSLFGVSALVGDGLTEAG